MNKFFCAVLLLGCVTLSSCVNPDSPGAATASSSSGGGGTTTTPPTATEASPLALRISTRYDQTEYDTTATFVETTNDTCGVTTSSPSRTCTIKIPEGRLYFSTVTFLYSWVNSKCKIFFFQPYYYQASTAAGFLPPWTESAIDCSATPIPKTCYGGAAPYMIGEFPKKTTIVYLSDPDSASPRQESTKLKSAFSYDYGSNRLSVNDINPASIGGNIDFGTGDKYLANTYTDYVFSCRDDWYDPVTYQITLHITDEDTSSTGADDIKTWK